MAVMRISSTAAAGNISGSRVGEGIVASFLLLVRALAVPSSAEECYSRIPTNFDYGATFLPAQVPNLVLWFFQKFWELLIYLSLHGFSAWVNQEIRLIWSGMNWFTTPSYSSREVLVCVGYYPQILPIPFLTLVYQRKLYKKVGNLGLFWPKDGSGWDKLWWDKRAEQKFKLCNHVWKPTVSRRKWHWEIRLYA